MLRRIWWNLCSGDLHVNVIYKWLHQCPWSMNCEQQWFGKYNALIDVGIWYSSHVSRTPTARWENLIFFKLIWRVNDKCILFHLRRNQFNCEFSGRDRPWFVQYPNNKNIFPKIHPSIFFSKTNFPVSLFSVYKIYKYGWWNKRCKLCCTSS